MILFLQRLIYVEIKRENFQQAFDYAKRSLDLNLKHYGENDSRVGTFYNTLAEIHLQRNESEESINYYEKGLRILQDCPDFPQSQAIKSRLLLASAYFKKQDGGQAKVIIDQAIKDIIRTEGENCINLAELYHFWAEILARRSTTVQEGIEFFLKALKTT